MIRVRVGKEPFAVRNGKQNGYKFYLEETC